MSLYYEAEKFLSATGDAQTATGTPGASAAFGSSGGGSLKARIFNAKNLKSTPSQVFALVTEASKWSGVLKEVIEKAQILKYEHKVSTTKQRMGLPVPITNYLIACVRNTD